MADLTSHWRKLYDNKYLGAWNLWSDAKGRYVEVRARIAKVSDELVIGQMGRKSRPVQLHLMSRKGPFPAPMIVTKTTGKTLEILFGPRPADWVGKDITLGVVIDKKVKMGTGAVLTIKREAGRDEDIPEQPPPPELDLEDESGAREPGEEG
jgi:hypothetical protein